MRLHEFIKDADDKEVTELIGAVARGIGGAAKLGARAVSGATSAIGSMAGAMGEPGVAAAMKTPADKGTGAVQKALAKTEKDHYKKSNVESIPFTTYEGDKARNLASLFQNQQNL